MRPLCHFRISAAPASMVALCAAIFVSGALLSAPARAQVAPTNKVAGDLLTAILAPTTPLLNWATDLLGVRYVKALVVSNSTDPSLAALRAAVLADGGSVYYHFVSVPALLVLPANKVASIAARSDVQSI